MNKKDIAKNNTRKLLLRTARNEFLKKGFINTSTESITRKAKIAHGTLFLHFSNKENLILEVYDIELKKVTNNLYFQLKDAEGLEAMLNNYFDYMQKNERFFAIIAKETPFYPDKLRRKIFFREGALRGYFYSALEKGIADGIYKKIDITMAINFLFGTINYFLALNEAFGNKSVIAEKRNLITLNFLEMLKK